MDHAGRGAGAPDPSPRAHAVGTRDAADAGPGTPDGDPARAARRVAVVVVLLSAVVLATALTGPWQPPVQGWGEDELLLPELVVEPPPEPTEPPEEGAFEERPPPAVDLGWLVALAVVALSLAVGWFVLHVLRRVHVRGTASDAATVDDSPGAAVGLHDRAPDLEELRRGVGDAADHLRAAVRAADAVIAAWVVLEEAAERSGTPRHPAATPTEFTVAVLDRTDVDPAAVRTLLDLYLRARFGQERLSRDDVVVATDAVQRLAEGLR